jgi:hypothetical protein
MTKALKKAFDAASRLPDPDQDSLAGAILEELALTEQGEVALAASQDRLERLADEAIAEHREGKTEPLNPDTPLTNRTTERFRKTFVALPAQVQRRARLAYRRFLDDPTHPSLDFKQVHPVRPIFSARIGLGYRALATRDGDALVRFWIGSHADYDQMLRML